ncbi:MAG: hypothetical protein EZS28_016938 [Streblomastix strix]|uniref:Uncharacterized protein n=1 Tax=Streblomastix strix TaxID=222440 RepID=A0A5J4VXZ8_9EUKA|nr:MAG: hypothetical protein EZS28_016938 [Streblomastix strix]
MDNEDDNYERQQKEKDISTRQIANAKSQSVEDLENGPKHVDGPVITGTTQEQQMIRNIDGIPDNNEKKDDSDQTKEHSKEKQQKDEEDHAPAINNDEQSELEAFEQKYIQLQEKTTCSLFDIPIDPRILRLLEEKIRIKQEQEYEQYQRNIDEQLNYGSEDEANSNYDSSNNVVSVDDEIELQIVNVKEIIFLKGPSTQGYELNIDSDEDEDSSETCELPDRNKQKLEELHHGEINPSMQQMHIQDQVQQYEKPPSETVKEEKAIERQNNQSNETCTYNQQQQEDDNRQKDSCLKENKSSSLHINNELNNSGEQSEEDFVIGNETDSTMIINDQSQTQQNNEKFEMQIDQNDKIRGFRQNEKNNTQSSADSSERSTQIEHVTKNTNKQYKELEEKPSTKTISIQVTFPQDQIVRLPVSITVRQVVQGFILYCRKENQIVLIDTEQLCSLFNQAIELNLLLETELFQYEIVKLYLQRKQYAIDCIKEILYSAIFGHPQRLPPMQEVEFILKKCIHPSPFKIDYKCKDVSDVYGITHLLRFVEFMLLLEPSTETEQSAYFKSLRGYIQRITQPSQKCLDNRNIDYTIKSSIVNKVGMGWILDLLYNKQIQQAMMRDYNYEDTSNLYPSKQLELCGYYYNEYNSFDVQTYLQLSQIPAYDYNTFKQKIGSCPIPRTQLLLESEWLAFMKQFKDETQSFVDPDILFLTDLKNSMISFFKRQYQIDFDIPSCEAQIKMHLADIQINQNCFQMVSSQLPKNHEYYINMLYQCTMLWNIIVHMGFLTIMREMEIHSEILDDALDKNVIQFYKKIQPSSYSYSCSLDRDIQIQQDQQPTETTQKLLRDKSKYRNNNEFVQVLINLECLQFNSDCRDIANSIALECINALQANNPSLTQETIANMAQFYKLTLGKSTVFSIPLQQIYYNESSICMNYNSGLTNTTIGLKEDNIKSEFDYRNNALTSIQAILIQNHVPILKIFFRHKDNFRIYKSNDRQNNISDNILLQKMIDFAQYNNFSVYQLDDSDQLLSRDDVLNYNTSKQFQNCIEIPLE